MYWQTGTIMTIVDVTAVALTLVSAAVVVRSWQTLSRQNALQPAVIIFTAFAVLTGVCLYDLATMHIFPGIVDAEHSSALTNDFRANEGWFGIIIAIVLAFAGTALLVVRFVQKPQRAASQESPNGLSAEEIEYRQTKGRLATTETQLRVAVEHMASGIVMVDKEGNFSLLNDFAKEFFDFPEDLIALGQPLEGVIRYQAARGDYGEGDVEAIVQHMISIPEETIVYERQLATGCILEIGWSPMPGGGTVNIYTDITARKHAEAALQEALEKIDEVNRGLEQKVNDRTLELREAKNEGEQAAELAQLGRWVWDTVEDRCISCSEEFARIHGVSVEDFIATSATTDRTDEWVNPDDQQRYAETRRAAATRREGFDIEYRILIDDGFERYVREISQPVFDQNGKQVQTRGGMP